MARIAHAYFTVVMMTVHGAFLLSITGLGFWFLAIGYEAFQQNDYCATSVRSDLYPVLCFRDIPCR